MASTAFPEGLTDNPWKQSKQSVLYPALESDLQADVVVVGAGVAGLTIAYRLATQGRVNLSKLANIWREPGGATYRHLCFAGKKVAVLENRVRGAGQSGRDTGELWTWNNHHYSKFQDELGAKVATQIAQSQLDAVGFVRNLVKQEGIPCGLSGVPTYLSSSERLVSAEARAYHTNDEAASQVHNLTICALCLFSSLLVLAQHHLLLLSQD